MEHGFEQLQYGWVLDMEYGLFGKADRDLDISTHQLMNMRDNDPLDH